MNTYLLFGLLASLAVQAAPAKRQCHRRPGAGPASDAVGNDIAIQTTNVAEAQSTSLSAVAAWAQGPGRGSRGGWRSRTARPPAPTGGTLSAEPIVALSTASGPSASDAAPADSSLANPAPPAGEPANSAAPTTTLDANNNVAVPTVTSQTSSSATSSATAGAAAASTSSGASAGSKRAGLAINEDSVKSFSGFLGGSVGWYTGWAATPLTGTDGLEWVPQVWGSGDVAGVQTKGAAWPAGVTHVLSFNERKTMELACEARLTHS